jgi:hypothetical protein
LIRNPQGDQYANASDILSGKDKNRTASQYTSSLVRPAPNIYANPDQALHQQQQQQQKQPSVEGGSQYANAQQIT